ncbi:MAG: hypothetical protein JNL30_00445 [Rubrivivax sp.]|nr:hypothetical protein [Rubrivivax sp.]
MGGKRTAFVRLAGVAAPARVPRAIDSGNTRGAAGDNLGTFFRARGHTGGRKRART